MSEDAARDLPEPQPATDVAAEVPPQPSSRRGSRQVIGPFSVRHLVVANTVIAVVLVILFAAVQPLGNTNPSAVANPQATFFRLGSATQGLQLGEAAPELTGTDNGQSITLMDLDGRPISLAALRGHPVWINFWATWCPPCQRETPDLRAAYEAHRKDGLVLIGIDVQEESGTVRDYVTRYGLTYTIGMDVTGAVFHTYRVFGLPTQYFVDRNGVIRDRVLGPLDRAGMEQKLAEIINP